MPFARASTASRSSVHAPVDRYFQPPSARISATTPSSISSGAVIHVARRIAHDLDEGNIVCLLADGGWKYLSTDAWAAEIDVAEKRVEEALWW